MEHSLKLHGVTLMEQHWFQRGPNVRVSPMFAEDIQRIDGTSNMGEVDIAGSNGLTDKVEGEHVVSFVELGIDVCAALHNRLIVTKDIALLPEWDSKVGQ